MLFKKDELKLLWPFYAAYLIMGISVMILPYMIIYYQQRGFSFLEISIIMAALSLGMLFFEIPTGAFADSYSRKKSVMIGAFLRGASALLIPFIYSFAGNFIILLVSGASLSFISGADEAWVVDNLKKLKRKDLQHEYFVKTGSIVGIGIFIGPLIAAVIVNHYPIGVLWYVWGVGAIITGLLLGIVKEHYVPKKRSPWQAIMQSWNQTKKSAILIRKNSLLLLLAVSTVLIGQINAAGEIGWQPTFINLGLPLPWLGVVFSIAGLGMVVGPFASKLFVKWKVKNAIILLASVEMAILLSLFLIKAPFYILAVAAFILTAIVSTAFYPILAPGLHRHLPTKIRATGMSTINMAKAAMYSIMGIFLGWLMNMLGPQTVIGLCSLIGFFAIATLLRIDE